MNYATRYAKLNPAQQQAVDTIDGPVMVIAGPGTGKTELLGMRTAAILKQTDTLPENILCLTFTDSGASAMRDRLTSIIGKDAYKVAIHTFHSFGSEVINQNGDFFYQGADFRPADELSSYEIIRMIFDELDYTNPLASKMNGEYTHLRDTLSVISELKKSGLTSDELLSVLDANDSVISTSEKLLAPVFANKIDKNTADVLTPHIPSIRNSGDEITLSTIVPLSRILADSLQQAVDQAAVTNSTKPVTAWRNAWMKKNESGEFILKSRDRQSKLRAVSYIYYQYLSRMQEAELYDFDDMILRVVHAIEVFDELRFNLQEKYQYIMVDEFQDTNMAQMRILHNLTNNKVNEGMPNILVVGDDDQAIYSFQGADISNIINFQETYSKATLITLTDNYRSTAPILDQARSIIVQGSDRLETRITALDKQLTAHQKDDSSIVSLYATDTASDERQWVVSHIKQQIDQGKDASTITVLTRRHHEIMSLLPYFAHAGIAVNYERRDNVLELEPIVVLEQLAQVLMALHENRHADANALLPELLAHPAWRIAPIELWKLSVKAYEARARWLDTMALLPQFIPLQEWLVNSAAAMSHQPLEHMLDILIGKVDEQASDDEKSGDIDKVAKSWNALPSADLPRPTSPDVARKADDTGVPTTMNHPVYTSPLYIYFFSPEKLADQPDEYLVYLEALRTIRTKLREYHPEESPKLQTFIEFIDLHQQLGSTISSIRVAATTASGAVNLMTAHKSKGLEFDTVYIIGAIDTAWGEKARSRSRLIGYPENLPLAPAGESSDERLRLFYVAATRAKRQLFISYADRDDNGKSLLRANFLLGDNWSVETIESAHTEHQAQLAAEQRWYERFAAPDASLAQLLAPTLERYKLSVTHLNNFLDVTRGGPQTFLLNNLLRFPQAMSPAAAYGSAIHNTLQRAHAHLAATKKQRAVEDILQDFENTLSEQRLDERGYETLLQKGSDTLRTFLDAKYDSFTVTQKSELNFSGQQSIVGSAHLTGALDLVDIDPLTKSIIVTDYKTGKPSASWTGKTDYEKIKLHKYRQQLMFYKLLIEHSRDYRSYRVEQGILQFVEPTHSQKIVALDASFTSEELDRFTQLINVIWDRIITLNLPSIASYDPSYKGMVAFEQDLLDNNI